MHISFSQALLEGVRKLRHQGAASCSTHSNTDDNDNSGNNSNDNS